MIHNRAYSDYKEISIPGDIIYRIDKDIDHDLVQIGWSCQRHDILGTFKITIYNGFDYVYDGLAHDMSVVVHGKLLELTHQEKEELIMVSIMDS